MFGRFVVFVAVLALSFSSLAYAKSPPPGAGVGDVPANVFFLLDTSGSMDEYVSDTESFSYPYDVASDSKGNVYIAEEYGGIAVFDKDGNYVSRIGSYSSASVSRAKSDEFYYVFGVATDSSDNVYVCDVYHKRVQIFKSDLTFKSSISLGNYCYGVEISPDDTLYVTQSDGNIYRFSSTGTSLGKWNMSGSALAVAFDKDGRHYVLRLVSNAYRIYVYNKSMTLEDYVQIEKKQPYAISPVSLAVDNNYSIYVSDADYYTSKVFKITKKSTVSYINDDTDVASTSYIGGSRSSTKGYFRTPYGVHFDKYRNDVLIADNGNHRVQSYTGASYFSGLGETRLDVMKKVIKKIVSDSSLTDGAYFGLADWNSSATMRVKVASQGAADIYSTVDNLKASGNTYLDGAMTLASQYFLGKDSPRDSRIPCQKNILIVVSDGYWENKTATTTAKTLSKDYDILTHVIGFQVTGDNNYVDMAKAGGTYPESPLFAEDWTDLYEKIAGAVRAAISADLTFAAPTIMPDVVGDDHILQATFRYKAYHQWKGRLKKYLLTDDGYIGALQWDAGERLNVISADARKLWTAAPGLPSGTNNFIAANVKLLQPALESRLTKTMAETDAVNLIQFVRGKDVYGEFASGADDEGDKIYPGDRWKLADVYHSRALAVGVPAARYAAEANAASEAYYRYARGYGDFVKSAACGGSCAARKGVVYVGSNGGMVHAFDQGTGDELWGFIPPMLLGAFKDMRAPSNGSSYGIFGVDGSPAVKDVYDGAAWHTVLVVGLRQGGSGYSVLDVTDPTHPSHIYSITYDNYNGEVVYWDKDGTTAKFRASGAVPAGFDARKLGEGWSDPAILLLPSGEDGALAWNFVAAGGYNSGTNSAYGNAVFAFDLFGASPVAAQTSLPDLYATDGIANAAPPPLTVVNADTTSKFPYQGAMLYVTDLQGQVWKLDATNRGHFMEARRVLDLGTTRANVRFPFQQLVSAFSEGKLYHLAGTGDAVDPDAMSSSVDNRLFAVADEDFPNLLQQIPHNGGTLEAERSPYSLSQLNVGGFAGQRCDAQAAAGWHIKLADSGKILSPVTVFNHEVLAPVYYPNPLNVCSGGGSKLLEIALGCGAKVKETDLGGGVSTRAVVYNNKVYLGISDSESSVALPAGFVKTGNLIVGKPANERAAQVEIESWWEGR
ncbi:MAG: VWA domain-containing protein [Rickettsiales bacterium]